MSLVLRHDPARAGLKLDDGGWVLLDELLKGMCADGVNVSKNDVLNVVDTSDKKRFTLSQDGTRIRAAQGHSVSVDLGLEAKRPPATLLHGTAEKNIPSILENGLLPGERQHVHLSLDEETALKVGQRHGKPKVLKIDSGSMFEDGHLFWISDNHVWLTKSVPTEYISLMDY